MTDRRSTIQTFYTIMESISTEQLISKVSTMANQSYYVLVGRIERLIEAGLVSERKEELGKTGKYRRYIVLTEKGQEILSDLRKIHIKTGFEVFT